MSEKVVPEESPILLYRRIANEVFRKDFGTEFQEAILEASGFGKVLEALADKSVAAKIDEIISDSINASLHTLFHWAAEYEAPNSSEEALAMGMSMQLIAEITKHMCPAFKDEQ